MSSTPAQGRLRTLRAKVTALIAGLVAIAVAGLAVLAVQLDARVRDGQLASEATLASEALTRRLISDDQPLDADWIADDLEAGEVVGLRPVFDVFAAIGDENRWDEVREPEPDELRGLVAEVFWDLEWEIQDAVLDIDNRGDLSDEDFEAMLDVLYDDPPAGLEAEAERRWYTNLADEAGIELVHPMEVITGAGVDLDDDVLLDALDQVADGSLEEAVALGGDPEVIAHGGLLVDGSEARGATLAVVDPSESDAAHRRFLTTIAGVSLALAAGSAVAAWVVAGRSIRPAADAVGQQERFLADAAHELRTPVAAIRATAEAGLLPEGDHRSALERVVALSSEASALTDDLLTLARIDADQLELRFEPIRLDLLCEAIVGDLPTARMGPASETIVMGDQILLERAISNLVRNAVAHGGASVERPAVVGVGPGGVVVSDEGLGVAPHAVEQIFERFASRPGSTGHGLGLPLARWIARSHGGELTCDPVAAGARFTLQLPEHQPS